MTILSITDWEMSLECSANISCWPHQSGAYTLTNLDKDGVVLAKLSAMVVDWVQQLGKLGAVTSDTASATQGCEILLHRHLC